MGWDTADADGGGPRPPGLRRTRRLAAAGIAVGVALLLVIAVLATRLASMQGTPTAPPAASPTPTPTPTTSMTVPDIYQRVAPSVVTIRTGHDLGTGVIVSDDGMILT